MQISSDNRVPLILKLSCYQKRTNVYIITIIIIVIISSSSSTIAYCMIQKEKNIY